MWACVSLPYHPYLPTAVGLCGNTGANVRELLLWYLNHEHNPAVLAETANACRTLAIVNDTSISTALADLVDNTEGVTRRCIEEALATSNALVHKSEGASEALDTISTLVKTMGTKSAITMQVCNMDNKEYEEWISME